MFPEFHDGLRLLSCRPFILGETATTIATLARVGFTRRLRQTGRRETLAMAELINLNKARKVRSRAGAKAQAAQNRIRFGQSKAETLAAKLEAARAQSDLSGKKLAD